MEKEPAGKPCRESDCRARIWGATQQELRPARPGHLGLLFGRSLGLPTQDGRERSLQCVGAGWGAGGPAGLRCVLECWCGKTGVPEATSNRGPSCTQASLGGRRRRRRTTQPGAATAEHRQGRICGSPKTPRGGIRENGVQGWGNELLDALTAPSRDSNSSPAEQ